MRTIFIFLILVVSLSCSSEHQHKNDLLGIWIKQSYPIEGMKLKVSKYGETYYGEVLDPLNSFFRTGDIYWKDFKKISDNRYELKILRKTIEINNYYDGILDFDSIGNISTKFISLQAYEQTNQNWIREIKANTQKVAKFELTQTVLEQILGSAIKTYCGSESEIKKSFNSPTLISHDLGTLEYECTSKKKQDFITPFNIYIISNPIVGDVNNDKTDDYIINGYIHPPYAGNYYLYFFVLYLNKNNSFSFNGIYDISILKHNPQNRAPDDNLKITNIQNSIVYGSYKGWEKTDPHCCPSLTYSFSLTFSNNKLQIDSENLN